MLRHDRHKWCLFTAPKTGSASLAFYWGDRYLRHQDPTWFHEVLWSDWIKKVGYKVYATVRDPRERFVSLWKHYGCEVEEVDVLTFARSMIERRNLPSKTTYPEFFSGTLSDWYAPILGKIDDVIRLERFDKDCRRLLGIKKIGQHRNRIAHGSYADYSCEELDAIVLPWAAEDLRHWYAD